MNIKFRNIYKVYKSFCIDLFEPEVLNPLRECLQGTYFLSPEKGEKIHHAKINHKVLAGSLTYAGTRSD